MAAAPQIEQLHSLCDEINNLNEPSLAVAVELDVNASGPTIEAALIKAWSAFGSIDALINNAGVRVKINFDSTISHCFASGMNYNPAKKMSHLHVLFIYIVMRQPDLIRLIYFFN
ncbi:SDR family NAD(P)-dependent oxidoreductase [Acinetobacter baumannii]